MFPGIIKVFERIGSLSNWSLANGIRLYGDPISRHTWEYRVRCGSGRKKVTLAALGQCMYCGVFSDEAKLTDEHILPDGLGGDLILPKSSCETCQKFIQDTYERQVIEKNFLFGRYQQDLWARKKRNRPSKRKSRFFNTISSKTLPEGRYGRLVNVRGMRHEVSPEMIAVVAMETTHAPPDLLTDPTRDERLISAIEFQKTPKPIGGAGGIQIDQGVIGTFTKFLCKVAHSYAIAMLGKNSFQPFLIDHILNDEFRSMSRFVGIKRRSPVQPDLLHRLHLRDNVIDPFSFDTKLGCYTRHFVIVEITLFNNLPTHPRMVIVGSKSIQTAQN